MTPKLLVSPRLFPTIVGSLHLSPYPLPSLALTSSFHVLVLVLHALLRSRSQFVSSPFLFPFLASSSFPLRFPVPEPQVCSIAGSRPSLVYLFRMVFCFGCVFPVETVRFVFLSFPCCFLPLPFVRLFPPQFSCCFPAHRAFQLFPGYLSISGSTAPFLGLGSCGPRVPPKRPHTSSLKRQSSQGRDWSINLSTIRSQSTGNRGIQGCGFINFHCKNINCEVGEGGL